MAGTEAQEKGTAAYAREALAEWGDAARYGLRAVVARRREGGNDKPPLKERLNPSRTEKGGRLGDAADLVLSKLGTPGKLASKGSLGSRVVERLRAGGDGADPAKDDARRQEPDDSDGERDEPALAEAPMPIQESVDVAVPLKTAFALCVSFDEYSEFLDRVDSAERTDETRVTVLVRTRGSSRELELELLDERPNERLDWECVNGIEHSGVISFHQLAPRLTRVELTIEFEPRGLVERLSRRMNLPDRAVREELRRFKAFAELWEEDSEEEQVEEEPVDEEPVDEESVDEEPVDEEELEDGDYDEDEEYEDEEEYEEDEGPQGEALEDEEDFDEEEELEDEELEEGELEDEELEDEELEEGELEPAGSER